jgi:hypothetical protein
MTASIAALFQRVGQQTLPHWKYPCGQAAACAVISAETTTIAPRTLVKVRMAFLHYPDVSQSHVSGLHHIAFCN